MKSKMLALLAVAIMVLATSNRAKADTITDSGVTVTGSVTATTVTLTFECTEAGCVGWFLGDVTLKGFTFTGDPTLGTAPTGYTVMNGGQNNNAVGAGGGCNSTQTGQAVCWDTAIPLTTQLGLNTVITFTANITDGVAVPPLHVQATAYNNSAGGEKKGGKVWAISSDLTGTPVPEPGTLALFGTGILSIAGFLRRKMLA